MKTKYCRIKIDNKPSTYIHQNFSHKITYHCEINPKNINLITNEGFYQFIIP